MVDSHAEQAKEVLEALDMWRVPVDPFAIAKEEGIELAPGLYGRHFDARIEYLCDVDTFAIFFQETGEGRPEGRVRFSIAHELGHYYLPDHRSVLLSGLSHNSEPDFRSKDPREREADEFAADLLMPQELFVEEVEPHQQGVCVLSELCRLASEVFHTSVTSTVRRYCQQDFEPCAVVLSENGKIKWAEHSYSMQQRGLSYLQFGSQVPPVTKTASLWKRGSSSDLMTTVEGSVEAGAWYDRPYSGRIWEEGMLLGRTGLVLTYLTLEEAHLND